MSGMQEEKLYDTEEERQKGPEAGAEEIL